MSKNIIIFCMAFISVEIQAQEKEVNFAGPEIFQLTSPQMSSGPVLFSEKTTAEFSFEYPGATIVYSDSDISMTGESKEYIKPIEVNKTCGIYAKAVHPSFMDSEIVSRQFFKIGHDVSGAEVIISPNASDSYSAQGALSLIDLKKGDMDFRQGDFWLGFQSDTVQIDLKLKNELTLTSLSVSTLRNHGAWIFFPDKVEVFSEGKMIGELELGESNSLQREENRFITIDFWPTPTSNLSVKIISQPLIPDWHPSAGSKPWLFIDEVLLN